MTALQSKSTGFHVTLYDRRKTIRLYDRAKTNLNIHWGLNSQDNICLGVCMRWSWITIFQGATSDIHTQYLCLHENLSKQDSKDLSPTMVLLLVKNTVARGEFWDQLSIMMISYWSGSNSADSWYTMFNNARMWFWSLVPSIVPIHAVRSMYRVLSVFARSQNNLTRLTPSGLTSVITLRTINI